MGCSIQNYRDESGVSVGINNYSNTFITGTINFQQATAVNAAPNNIGITVTVTAILAGCVQGPHSAGSRQGAGTVRMPEAGCGAAARLSDCQASRYSSGKG